MKKYSGYRIVRVHDMLGEHFEVEQKAFFSWWPVFETGDCIDGSSVKKFSTTNAVETFLDLLVKCGTREVLA